MSQSETTWWEVWLTHMCGNHTNTCFISISGSATGFWPVMAVGSKYNELELRWQAWAQCTALLCLPCLRNPLPMSMLIIIYSINKQSIHFDTAYLLESSRLFCCTDTNSSCSASSSMAAAVSLINVEQSACLFCMSAYQQKAVRKHTLIRDALPTV